jgi:hypothetical protein
MSGGCDHHRNPAGYTDKKPKTAFLTGMARIVSPPWHRPLGWHRAAYMYCFTISECDEESVLDYLDMGGYGLKQLDIGYNRDAEKLAGCEESTVDSTRNEFRLGAEQFVELFQFHRRKHFAEAIHPEMQFYGHHRSGVGFKSDRFTVDFLQNHAGRTIAYFIIGQDIPHHVEAVPNG